MTTLRTIIGCCLGGVAWLFVCAAACVLPKERQEQGGRFLVEVLDEARKRAATESRYTIADEKPIEKTLHHRTADDGTVYVSER